MYKSIKIADVAQLAEQLTCNQQAGGSIPFISFPIKKLKKVYNLKKLIQKAFFDLMQF